MRTLLSIRVLSPIRMLPAPAHGHIWTPPHAALLPTVFYHGVLNTTTRQNEQLVQTNLGRNRLQVALRTFGKGMAAVPGRARMQWWNPLTSPFRFRECSDLDSQIS